LYRLRINIPQDRGIEHQFGIVVDRARRPPERELGKH
jgi:hypothetical protein